MRPISSLLQTKIKIMYSWTASFSNLRLLIFVCCFFSFTHSDEVQILMKLKSSLTSNSNLLDSWQFNTSPCNFTGISCNSNRSVTRIELRQQRLLGTLPFDSICQLPSLEVLNFGTNSLTGTITNDLNNCTKLQQLDLSVNSFYGTFPELSALDQLDYLRLDGNGFSGAFPWKSLQRLTNLTEFTIGDNPLDASLFPIEVLKLKKLSILYLTNCSLEGSIPAGIGDLTELTVLELSTNRLTGEIPKEIGNLQKLQMLEMYENNLTGSFPVGFGNLTNLQQFDASDNQLQGDLSELRTMKNLKTLQLFFNNFSGEIPEEFGDFEFLVNLSLYSNRFTGSLPQKLGSLADFDFIDASENLLTGPIPPDMCKKGKMTELLLIHNNFSGRLPASYANCLSLTRLRVSNNSLTGSVPAGIWGLPKLNFIDLVLNQFEGPVTSDIKNAKSLAQLRLQNNRFSGDFPGEIGEASGLVLIDLSFNQFSGEIPPSIGELHVLNSLYLQENMFLGNIPDSLSSCTLLNNVNFARNSISGQIPSSLGSLPSLNALNLSSNQLSGRIPESLSSLKLSLLDLSNNNLTGRIPESLSNQANNGSFARNSGLCSQSIDYFQPCSSHSGKSTELATILSCFLTGTIVVLVLLAILIVVKKKQKEQIRSISSDSWNIKSFQKLSFTEEEILNSIHQHNIIGKGGSGNVYKVAVQTGDELAVKHIWNSDINTKKTTRSSTAMLMKQSGNLPEFEAEVATLSSIRHVNVVKLYCSITSEDSSLLVYEYLPNGSLWDRLHICRDVKLDWLTRYEIALGAAKGLEYLHHGCDRPVVHRDVKSSNILLDEFFKPRIADFGLAKIVQANGGNASSHVIAGTHGYMAPEYAYTCKVNEKSDVYSFGVVLMELVTGKKPIEAEFGENKDIVYWVCSRIANEENIIDMVDSSIKEGSKEDAVNVMKIGLRCTARLPALRPSMRTVVQMLEDAQPYKLIEISIYKHNCGKEESPESSVKVKDIH